MLEADRLPSGPRLPDDGCQRVDRAHLGSATGVTGARLRRNAIRYDRGLAEDGRA